MPKSLPLILLLAITAVGCARQAPPVRPGAVGKTSAPAAGGDPNAAVQYAPWVPGGDPADPANRRVQGKTAADWTPQLKSREPAVRQQAADALKQLGEPGYAALFQSMKSNDPEVAIQAMQAIPQPALVAHQAETVPQLIAMLQRDANPAVREQAAQRLAWFDSTSKTNKIQAGYQARQRFDALTYAAQNDANPAVRTAAAGSLACIQQAMSGTVRGD